MSRRPTRREVLLGSGAALSAVSLGGCGTDFLSLEPTDVPEAAGHSGPKGREAPSLARMVKDGELPPVERRLPRNPLVLEPVDRVGQYGGVWENVMLNASDTPWLLRTLGGEHLMRWDPKWKDDDEPLPNVAESIESNNDATVFTINLRPGMRWSDGEPFTAEDIVFAFNDVLYNSTINPEPPWFFTSRGKPAKVERIGQHTVRVTFDHPNGFFKVRAAMNLGEEIGDITDMPKHYLQRFHADYNPDVKKLAEQQGFSSWGDMFNEHKDPWVNADKPSVRPWILTQGIGEGSQVIARRNPYFWKVDPDGSQLPYLDGVTYDVVTEEEVILLKATNGEIDFTSRHVNTLQNKPVLGHSRERGEYDFVDLKNTLSNDMVVAFNMTIEDPVKRKLYRNKDFRIGLSHAINRQEMITAIWQRQGKPWQAAPAPESRFYDEEFATQYLKYDQELANRHLDRAGLEKRDEEGWRLRPDGEPLIFEVEVANPALIPFWPDGVEAVCRFWRDVGVNAKMKMEDRSLFYERKDNNKQDAGVWTGDGGLGGEMVEARWYFPFSLESIFAPLWAMYFESRGEGDDVEKPPRPVLRQMELYWEMIETGDSGRRETLMRKILQIAKDQFYVIGTIRVPLTYGIVRDNFHNVPEMMPEASPFNTPFPAQPAQFFKS